MSKLEVDLNGRESEDDAARLVELDQLRKEGSGKFLAHKKLIADKYKAMRISKDTAKIEAEKAEKTRVSDLIKAEKKNKMEVRYKYVSQSVKDLKESLAALTMIETLSDADVKQAFSKVTE